MSDRDELVRVLHTAQCLDASLPEGCQDAVCEQGIGIQADAILARWRLVPILRSAEEIDALPLDAIVGRDTDVYQRIHRDDEATSHDGYGKPAVWAGIAFDNDPEYYSSGGVWLSLAGIYGERHPEHEWCELWHEGTHGKETSSDRSR